ncbi:hypothetical protein MKO06_02680 [Gramella sp. GC03-9]|uniref:Lipocalin-like domain-containing protein n=1 Tax=Christiangramia oceanisediminis TaxID=2920386 RepID=A0A9X2KW10_9FLAO|nr:hypothetical protein [Gramella oceanisediminis]MCP9198794.1 hypothetical protein [Gramella oceanisediminis]
MKTMKYILSLSLIIFLFWSCSTEDSPEIDPEEPIIGTWRPVTFAQFPVNGDPIMETIGECAGKTRITIKANGELTTEEYYNDQGQCKYEFIFQSWEKVSSGTYIFIETFTDQNGETTTYTTSPDEISFPDSNTMRIIYNSDYDQETELNYWYNEFKKN